MKRPNLYRVMRNCCTNGNCTYCRGKAPLGQPIRIEHYRTLNKELAEQMARNWVRLSAEVEVVK